MGEVPVNPRARNLHLALTTASIARDEYSTGGMSVLYVADGITGASAKMPVEDAEIANGRGGSYERIP